MTHKRGKYAAEFRSYGLPPWFVHVVLMMEFGVGGLFAVATVEPRLATPLGASLAVAMTAAVLLRIRAREEWYKAIPAASLVALAAELLRAPAVVCTGATTRLGWVATAQGRQAIFVGLVCAGASVGAWALLALYRDFRDYRAQGKSTWEWLNAAEPEHALAGIQARLSISPVEEVSEIARRWSKTQPLLPKPSGLTVQFR
jgi:hypothetical protein